MSRGACESKDFDSKTLHKPSTIVEYVSKQGLFKRRRFEPRTDLPGELRSREAHLPGHCGIRKLDAIQHWLTTNVRRSEAVIRGEHQKFSGGNKDRNGRGDRI